MRLIVPVVSIVTLLQCFFQCFECVGLTDEEIIHYREKVKQMFYHAYDSYVANAFAFDELKPITCEGMNTWGSFQLTTIDALDTLLVLGNYTEFERISNYVIQHLNFDQDINVSVFETNIRVVGGLLSAHLLSHHSGIKLEPGWPCSGSLLRKAEDVARRLLPAFDTPTGMPYGTVNLRHGVPKDETPITCTAGVGTFIVEFGTLSRLTGDPIFEKVALKALESLHSFRSDMDLVGNHLNTSDGHWIALDSTVGAGVDSYFEYLVKGSFLLQSPSLMDTFQVYYKAIKTHMKKDDWHFMVHMNSGLTTQPIFQSLEAFWPGLISMVGDLDEAKKTLLNYHQVWKKYGFMPEFYDVLNGDIKRNGYPLRPEFIESVFYLYKATKDPQMLQLGAEIIESINFSARTDCGYATVKDVKKHLIEDRMESFFIAETVKYLYLLFDHDNFIYNQGQRGKQIHVFHNNHLYQCIIDSGGYVFNTEAHPVDGAALDCCANIHQQNHPNFDNFFNQSKQSKLIKKLKTFNHEHLFKKLNLTRNYYSDISTSYLHQNHPHHDVWLDLFDSIDDENIHNDLNIDLIDSQNCYYQQALDSCDNCRSHLTTCKSSDFLQIFSIYGQVLPRDRTN